MSNLTKTAVAAGLVAVMAAVAPVAAQAKEKKGEVHLVLATGYGAKIAMNHVYKWLIAPRLVAYSGGRISTDVQQQNKLCSEHKCIEQVKLGQIDIGSSSAGNIGAFGQAFDTNFLPYLFKTDAYAAKVMDMNGPEGWYGKELRERVRKEMDLHLLASMPGGGFRSLQNSVREIRVPKDLKGIKIRVTKSPVEFSMIQAWGAIPIPYDWGQLYEGLQSGVVQGMYIPHLYTALRKFHEVTPYMTETGGGMVTLNSSMSTKRYDSLPKWAQEVITKVFAEAHWEAQTVDRMATQQALEILRTQAKIYEPTAEEYALWAAAAPKSWLKVKGRYRPETVIRLLDEQGLTEFKALLKKVGAI
jgi:TRAP-type C4-dicarboxylate transport system substrate-binding protein